MTERAQLDGTGLVDLLDRLLDTGVAAGGDITIALADVDLVHVHLRALLASVAAEQRGPRDAAVERPAWIPPPRRRRRALSAPLPGRIDAGSDSLETGLARLVVVAELLRDLLERQAIRRMQEGSLDADEIERLSLAFVSLDDRIDRMYADLAAAQAPSERTPRSFSRSTASRSHDLLEGALPAMRAQLDS